MSHSPFQKFISPKKNSAIKEEFKQAKRKAKKDRAAAINKRFEEKREQRAKPQDTSYKEQELKAQGTRDKGQDNKQQGKKPQGTSYKEQANPTSAHQQISTSSQPQMPLNKFLAHCGISSRRDAVELIKQGKVKVNNTVILEPAFKVSERDEIFFNNKKQFISKNLVYILLNKPKDYITTTDDPQGRNTVLQLVKHATTERIYPVGRLDRNTSGVLLLTNDGELTQKLSHPSYEVKKVYEARLDKPLTKADFDKILNGVKLEDGEVKADSLGYVDAKDKSVIGVEIHSGRNRIVRRIFEHLGYDVKALDRVMYGTLTKKNVQRGKWRLLNEKEVRLLKYLNKSKVMSNDNKHS